MLKSIALAGFFFFASAVTMSAASTANHPAKKASTIVAPTAPAPHGICPEKPC